MNDTKFVSAIGGTLSPDGTTAELLFAFPDGDQVRVPFPMHAASAITLQLEQTIGKLFEAQRAMLKGEDPRAFHAIGAQRVGKIQGAVAQGIPVLSLVLETGVRLDFSIPTEAIRDLAEWLRELEEGSRQPPSAAH